MIQRINARESARSREDRILQLWREEGTFVAAMKNRAHRPRFVIYEGPPGANGEPHIGHVLARVIKDFVGRYQTMRGYYVYPKAGWDTHGLPVELGVEKAKKLDGREAIEAYGVDTFIQDCRENVFRYKESWHKLTEAIGYWVDLENPYITLDPDYIESVWNALAKIHQKGLLQQGHRVSPYCPRCQTTLSSHEVSQGYKEVRDPSIIVSFPLVDKPHISLLAWTTTPWTLPSHVALAVNPTIEYVRIARQQNQYILAADLVDTLFGNEDYQIVERYRGRDLEGLTYQAPFPYQGTQQTTPAYRVIASSFVTATSGTGIVHMAPAHGEEDERAARENELPVLQLVDSRGRYREEVTDFAGRFVKDCDEEIIKKLHRAGRIVHSGHHEHSYPFCWRCDTPLLYMATTSWFIRTTAIKERLQAYNEQIRWLPSHVQKGRFGNFIDNLVDWNISRDRFWGTPLNVWICTSCDALFVPDSFSSLEKRMTKTPPPRPWDPHKPGIDSIEVSCPHCEGHMRRTPEVIDVWFDSGSMPFAQYHLPFSEDPEGREQYPADFICEGIDQTRGWFFSLLTISALLEVPPAYKTVLATGLVLDKRGQKMSKSKGNTVDPWSIINEYGADPFRWSLYANGSPWQEKRFSDTSVAEAKSQIIDTLVNAHSFFSLYAELDQFAPPTTPDPSPHWMDRWMISRLHTTTQEVIRILRGYDLCSAAKQLAKLIDDMSNWYIRCSRPRFWDTGMSEDKRSAFTTLHSTLVTLSRLLAPFLPFVTETIHRNLTDGKSVHQTDYPSYDPIQCDPSLEKEMARTRTIVELGRQLRNETGIPTRQPLASLKIHGRAIRIGQEAGELLKQELNVKKVAEVTNDELPTMLKPRLQLHLPTAGPIYGKSTTILRKHLQELPSDEAWNMVQNEGGTCTLSNGVTCTLSKEQFTVTMEPLSQWAMVHHPKENIFVFMDTTITMELRGEGWIRNIIRQIQNLRKEMSLPLEARINLELTTEDRELYRALQENQELLEKGILLKKLTLRNERAEESQKSRHYQVSERNYSILISQEK
ncbi:isoleucine--tRNA ligase [Pasteuria penetrans]|uniref:isoleucine--tRNA ligase n=1 Tax=Pasteuria penetrans TaxID=86005 RepID=UPI000F9BA8C9|nr:isoleucine--tRNA ligase [Pasteuria penetrans]